MQRLEEEKGRQKVAVSVNMSDSQKKGLKKMTVDWSIGLSAVLRQLVIYAIRQRTERNFPLGFLMKQYQKIAMNLADFNEFSARNEKKTYKVTVRLSEEDYQNFNSLAEEGFYRPGEFLSILVMLFIAKVIDRNKIWDT
ncbi:MAG: hypothetical protein LBP21_05370 [Synergistaceae bacterium]|nr:hypothetical protein [Synergistaceae bacterium]